MSDRGQDTPGERSDAPGVPQVLGELLSARGPSGYESAPAEVWRQAAGAFAQVSSDVVGTPLALIAPTHGYDSAPRRLLVMGHIDEIGLIVTHIDDEGYLWFSGVGGWDAQILVGQRVVLDTRQGPLPGVVGKKPIHLLREEDRKKVADMRELHIDIGARDGEQWELAAVAAVQEEITFGGSRTSAFALAPDAAIVIDVTHATDAPGIDVKQAGKHELGSGPVISRGSTLNATLFELLHDTAEAEQIPFTIEASARATGTDADAVHISRGGVPTGLVSIPVRYMHSPVEVVELADVHACARLVAAAALALERESAFAS